MEKMNVEDLVDELKDELKSYGIDANIEVQYNDMAPEDID